MAKSGVNFRRMMWRSISAVIVLFWAVMTGLIIRDAYFPDSSRFAELPPRMVFELFLSQSSSFNNQLHLYQNRDRIGQAHVSVQREREASGTVVYGLVTNGFITGGADGAPGLATSFLLRAELENGDQWRSFQMQTKTAAMKTVGNVAWKKGDKFPQIEVKKGDEVVLNSEIVQTMMAVSGGMGGMPGMPGAPQGAGQFDWLSQIKGAAGTETPSVKLTAREGVMDLAGKTRRCYILTASFISYEVKFFFTELGELARIEMPGNYRFVEPLMHGLEPGMKS
jgi:hypothetical protein